MRFPFVRPVGASETKTKVKNPLPRPVESDTLRPAGVGVLSFKYSCYWVRSLDRVSDPEREHVNPRVDLKETDFVAVVDDNRRDVGLQVSPCHGCPPALMAIRPVIVVLETER